jgi:hypothetical protein
LWGGKQTGIVNVAFGVDAGTERVLLEVSGSTPHLANSVRLDRLKKLCSAAFEILDMAVPPELDIREHCGLS